MGQATFSMPIDVSPGPAGLAPRLSIAYASNRGPGLLGLGFELSGLSEVRRCNRTIADDGYAQRFDFTNDDPICFQGERMVLVGGQYGDPTLDYRLRTDPTTRIWLQPPGVQSDHSTWLVETKDGRRRYYGSDDAGNYVVTNATGVPWRWMLEREEDRFGNTIEYEWTTVQGINLDQVDRVPAEIRYGDGRRIAFAYEPREDVTVRYASGQRQERPQRLLQVRVEGYKGALLHTYTFAYGSVAATNASLLTSVTKCDAAGACVPATTLDWTDVDSHYWLLANGDVEGVEESFAYVGSALTGDFDADGTAEIVIWDTEDDPPAVVEGLDAYPALLPVTTELPPLSMDDYARFRDLELEFAAAVAGVDPEEVSIVVDNVYQVQPAIRTLSANLFGGSGVELLYPLSQRVFGAGVFDTGGPNHTEDNRLDAWGVSFAVRMQIYNAGHYDAGTGFYQFGETIVDDDDDDRIYNVVPLDHDGNGLTDLWLCQGKGYKSGTWVLALNNGDTAPGLPYGFDYTNTGIRCSVHDELHVVGLHVPGRQSLLTIPAYDLLVDPETFNPVSDYIDGVPPTDDSGRLEYAEVDPAAGGLIDTGLPRDLFARWHDARCHNGIADAQLGIPIFGAGVSRDKLVDVNGDGLTDILRFELASGDDYGNIAAIKDGIEEVEWTYAYAGCDYEDASDHAQAVIRLYVNTGAGFLADPVPVHTFEGIAHANFWLNFVPARVLDENGDGRMDLLLPSDGVGGDWTVLRSTGSGTFEARTPQAHPNQTPTAPLWVRYDEDATWKEDAGWLAFNGSRTLETGGRGIAFHGLYGSEYTPAHRTYLFGLYDDNGTSLTSRVLLTGVTDGLGRTDTFSYSLETQYADHIEAPQRPAGPLREAMLTVARLDRQVGPDAYDSTTFAYEGPVTDHHGRGLVGFQSLTRTTLDTAGSGELALVRETYDLSWDATVADYPYKGQPERIEMLGHFTDANGDPRLEIECHDVEEWEIIQTTPGPWFAYAKQTRAHSGDVAAGATLLSDELTGCDELSPIEDDHEVVTEETRSPYGLVVWSETTVTGGMTTTVVTQPHADDLDNWFVGQPESVDTTSCAQIQGMPDCTTRTFDLVYDVPKHAVTATIREPTDPVLYLKTELAHDTFGNVDSVTQEDFGAVNSRTTTTLWDDEGVFPLETTTTVGGIDHTTWFVHHRASGALVAEVDPNGVTHKAVFDGFFRPREGTRHPSPLSPSDGNVRRRDYAPAPGEAALQIVESETATAQVLRRELGPAGKELRRSWIGAADEVSFPVPAGSAGDEVYVVTEYDGLGRVSRVSHPTWATELPSWWTTLTYDDLGRVRARAVTDDTGFLVAQEETWDYLHHSTVNWGEYPLSEVYTDPDDLTTTTVSDAHGRPVASVDADAVAACFTYGAFGRLVKAARNCAPSAGGRKANTTYTHDGLGRVLTEDDSVLGERSMTYTAWGEVDTATDGNSETVTFGYDDLGRRTTRNDSAGLTTWTWDTTFIGALDETESPDAVTRSFTYDEYGQLASLRTEAPGGDYEVSYTYTPDGRLATETYPELDTLTLAYAYDGIGNVRSIHDGTVAGDLIWGLRAANETGAVLEEIYGNLAVTTRSYDPATHRADTISTHASVGTVRQQLSFGWSPAGDLEWRQDSLNGQNETFTYDALHRLDTSSLDGVLDTDVNYDKLGNIKFKTGVGTYNYGTAGRLKSTVFGLTTTSYTYDGNGAVLSKGSVTMTRTPFGKVASIDDGTPITLSYDADGQRVVRQRGVKKVISPTANLDIEKGSLLAPSLARVRVLGAGRPVAEVTLTKAQFGSWVRGDTTYLHDDHLGSGNVVTATGSDAPVVHETAYDPWGQPRDPADWGTTLDPSTQDDLPLGFTGHRARPDAGFIDMRGRMYDPVVGRFMSPDPVIANALDGQSWNPYSYVLNRPLSLVDPTGLAAEDPDPEDVRKVGDALASGSAEGCNNGRTSEGGCARTVVVSLTPLVGAGNAPNGVFDNGPVGGYWSGNSLPNGGVRDPQVAGNPLAGLFNNMARLRPARDTSGDDFLGGFGTAMGERNAWHKMGEAQDARARETADSVQHSELYAAVGTYAEGVAAAMGIAEIVMLGAEFGLGSAASRALGKETLCFGAGTPVLTEDGLRPIEELEIGTLVWARDDETGAESWQPIVEVFVTPQRELLELTFEAEDGSRQELRVTPEHPLWSLDDGEWDQAGQLDLGEEVDALDGPLQLAVAIAVANAETVYNLEVGNDHTYFVGEAGLWVHNARGCTEAAAAGVKFGQASVKGTFAHGPFAGQSIGTVAKGLRSGKISPDELPIEFIVRNGERIALNNRSLTTLRRAGMEPTKLIDRTGVQRFEQLLDAHLRGGSPSDVIRIRGGPPGTSLIE